MQPRRLFLALTVIGLSLSLFVPGCGGGTQSTQTLAPTHALVPEATSPPGADPTPVLPLPTASPLPPPSATPTPEPVLIWPGPGLPDPLAQALTDFVALQAGRYALTSDVSIADVQVGGENGEPIATWVYVLVAPFPTITDGVSWDDLVQTWNGVPSGPFASGPLLVSEETLMVLQSQRILGAPVSGVVVAVPEAELLSRAWAGQPAWAIVPFEALEPRWKVLRVDDVSPLDQGLDPSTYPLVANVTVAGSEETLAPFLAAANLPVTNRDEGQMTVVVMTGVTALTRATAWRMEQKGLTYPAQDIGDWLRNADITHVSNEVAFDPECGPPDPVQVGVSFCSDPRYIALLEDIGVDVVEMTGNHIGDAGVEHIETTLDMYVERGWQYFGGGRNLDDARQPALFEHNGNAIAFLGCNPAGPGSVWATAEQAGAAPCDYELLGAQLSELRAQGVLPIVTLQYWEEDRYDPTPQQVSDFQALVEAGAVIVSGSHAHHVQGFSFHAGGFVHFGIGNLFFDQMEIMGNRQEFIDRHVFYAGRHISTELFTALLEDWSRPRPMTQQERTELLQTVFAVSRWE